MASALKRKRGSAEVLDTPKRSKILENANETPAPALNMLTSWESAFPAMPKDLELVKSNGVNGNGTDGLEVLDFDTVNDADYVRAEERRLRKAHELEKANKALKKAIKRREQHPWKLSEPIGGRMLDVDPVFTYGEKFLIVADRSQVHVYSTSDSLLTRSIKFDLDPKVRLITYYLSPTYENILWVAASDGKIYSVDWTNGAGAGQYWGVSSTGCHHMTVASMTSADRLRDIVFTTEPRSKGHGWRITANELASPDSKIKTDATTIYTSDYRIEFLKSANEGSVLVGFADNKILIGQLRSKDFGTVDKIKYQFRRFDTTERICALDLQVSKRTDTSSLKRKVALLPVVNLAVGVAKGAIFYYNDILAKLVLAEDGSQPAGLSLVPKKMHWHRKAVHSVKFSLDGNYIISGGSETVLVLWQLDTGRKQFLPHMTSTIQNLVVSPTGSSYAVQLADNSATILPTAEFTPTANIAGIQANTLLAYRPLEAFVRRVEEECWNELVIQRTPAVINPRDPSKLLLGVGPSQDIRPRNPIIASTPFLQTFDMGSGVSISRQALARNNVTNLNITPDANRLTEPRITHMKISSDGEWLATVDEWTPPARDLKFLASKGQEDNAEQLSRREVYLKIWQWGAESKSWELVSRIDSPHSQANSSSTAGKVLDLVVDPSSARFATIGEDSVVRTWVPKTRKRDGVVVKGKGGVASKIWHCEHSISLGKPELLDDHNNLPSTGSLAFSEDGSLLAAASDSINGLVYFLDPESGTIRLTKTGLFEKNILEMAFLAQDLIILSDKLNVYDLVAGELRSSTDLSFALDLSTTQKQQMFHLAVDSASSTYAVAIPRFHPGPDPDKLPKNFSIMENYSHTELIVFHQDKVEPQLAEEHPHLITALVASEGAEGFIVLDSSAGVRTVLKKGSQAITSTAQSTSAQGLDATPEEPTNEIVAAEEEEQIEAIEPLAIEDEAAAEDNETPVVSRQQLAQVFDIGPSYALPPLEQMFYQVVGLFSSQPLAQSV